MMAAFGSYDLMNSRIESANLSITQIGKYDVYIRINKNKSSPIEFHIPRNQIDKMKHRPSFKYRDSKVGNMDTYLVGTSMGMFIKRNKRILEERIEEVSNYS